MAYGDPQNTNQSDGDKSESQSSQSKKPVTKKAKAGSSKKMTQKEQSERFIGTARALGVENQEEFEHALKVILPDKSGPK